MKRYTKENLKTTIQVAAQDMATFYQRDFINYFGKTSDTDEPYTEIISEWLLSNLDVLKKIPVIDRKKGYYTDTHDGQTTAIDSNREEERIAMALFRRKKFQSLGTILDYQTPLKNTRNDCAGKIDLLSYDGKIVRILELKKPDSTESMLRCVLESYTYLQTIANQQRFIGSFEGVRLDAAIKASPLVFAGHEQWKQMHDENYSSLHKLMKTLDIQPFYITGDTEEKYDITPG